MSGAARPRPGEGVKLFSFVLALAFLTLTFLPTAVASCEFNGLPETHDCAALVEAEANAVLGSAGVGRDVDLEETAVKACHPLLAAGGPVVRAWMEKARPVADVAAPGAIDDVQQLTYLRDTCRYNVYWYL